MDILCTEFMDVHGLGLKVIDAVSCAVPDDQSGKKHGHTSDTETAGDPCVCGNDESVHQSGQISIHSLPSHSDMASPLHTTSHLLQNSNNP